MGRGVSLSCACSWGGSGRVGECSAATAVPVSPEPSSLVVWLEGAGGTLKIPRPGTVGKGAAAGEVGERQKGKGRNLPLSMKGKKGILTCFGDSKKAPGAPRVCSNPRWGGCIHATALLWICPLRSFTNSGLPWGWVYSCLESISTSECHVEICNIWSDDFVNKTWSFSSAMTIEADNEENCDSLVYI